MAAKAKPALPNPAAVLPGEADILANVIANLADHDAKLVYADWLEERDDPRGPQLREFIHAYRQGKKLPWVEAPEPWRDLVGITLIDEASEELAPFTDTFLRLARPALRLESQVTPDEELSIGVSKLGGSPDMPTEVEWPEWVWEHGEPKPHSFMAQINLVDLGQSVVARDLPHDGVLSFFWEQEDATDSDCVGGWGVFHFRDIPTLVRRKNPSVRTWWSRSDIRSVTFTETLTLPKHNDSPVSAELGLKYEDIGAYECLHPHFMGDYLLGHPRPLHSDVLRNEKNRLLLQLSAGEMLYFTIHEEDLREQRFDRVGFAFQR